MDSKDNVKESYTFTKTVSKDDSNNSLEEKFAELEKMQENLKQAKDDAMQSWLDSRPLIDELEKMQEELASVKSRVSKANATISELQSQLETIEIRIKSKKEEEVKYRMLINDKNQDLHREQEEMEQLKMKIDRKRRRRTKLRQVLRLKKQTLETLLLTHEAIKLESEAFETSAAQALFYLSQKEDINIMVQITREEYDLLKREAREQTSMAEWRISVSAEEKIAAESSRDSAFDRLQKVYPRNGSNRRYKMESTIDDENIARKIERRSDAGAGSRTKYRRHRIHKDREKSPDGVSKRIRQQQNNGESTNKKRTSICFRIRKIFIRKVSRCFKRSSM